MRTMGIRWLYTFVNKCVPNGHFKVKIDEEIERWKSENTGQHSDPVILIDLYSLCGQFVNSDALMGGRHHLLLKNYETFFQKLIDSGAKLIFFSSGCIDNDNDQNMKSKNKIYLECIEILDKVQRNGDIYFVDKIHKMIGGQTILSALKYLCQRYGDLITVWKNRMNLTSSKFSRFFLQNQVFAIVANNMNFLIYDAKWKLWSSRSLDVKQFSVNEYHREALMSQLKLTAQQLKILVTISGNEIIPHEDLKPFHKRLNAQFHDHFYKLANYVRGLPSDVTLEEIIKQISNEIYGSEEDKFLKLLADSIHMYDLSSDSKLDTAQEIDQKMLWETTRNRFLNAITTGQPISLVLRFMDLRRIDVWPYFYLFKPILRRAIGVFRCHIESETNYLHVVRAKVKHDEPYTEFKIAPEYATHIEIPKDLTFGKDEDDLRYHQLRLDIVKWIIFGDDSIKLDIEKIPQGYMVTVIVLKYLMDHQHLTTVEADAILLCMLHVHSNRVPADIILRKVGVRTIIISNLYTKLYNEIVLCFISAGLRKSIVNDFLVYDGPHFADLLSNLLNMSDEKYESATLEILPFRQFL